MSIAESPPKLRVINTRTVGELHEPTKHDPEGGIIQSIRREGVPLFQEGEHVAIEVGSRRPHHPDGSKVIWIIEQSKTGCIADWSADSWHELARNSAFLLKLEHHAKETRLLKPDQRFYLFLGFRPPEKDFTDLPVYPYALQSQRRGHIHDTEPVGLDTPHDRLLDGQFDHDGLLAALFLNLAGEASIDYYAETLRGVGTRLEFTQPIGVDGSSVVTRTVLGFDGGLEEALQAALTLQEAVSDSWLDHAATIARQVTSPFFPDLTLHVKQCPVPSFAIMLPTDGDRRIGNIAAKPRATMMPFSVTTVQSAFAEGGVIFDHKAQSLSILKQ